MNKRETSELESQIILWKQKAPSPPLVSIQHIYVNFTDQEASLDNLLLEYFWSDTLYFQYLSKDNEHIEDRVRGHNSRSVARDTISRESGGERATDTRMHLSPRETLACL
jgi:hypothetical protein